jgi:hydrophobe/amphiphile efflux-1 (HAE1) family protein
MTLSEFSLGNRYAIYALAIAAVIFGTLAYLSLPIQLFPDTAPPLVNVLTPYPGAVAEDVAELVSDPIEDESASLEGVYKVTSTSQDGLSLVTVEFRYDVLVDLAAVDVQNAISRIRGSLPKGIGEPQVLKFSTSNRPVLTMGLAGDNPVEVRDLAQDVLAPELQRVPGVALVDVFGGYKPEIAVSVDRDRLEAHRLPLGAVVEAIRTHNVSVPAGQVRSAGRQYTFRVDAQSQSLGDIARIPLTTPAGKQIRVGHVATITEGSAEDLSRFRVNGQSAIAMQVFKRDDANTVEVVELARARFGELSRHYPDIRMTVAEESASFTRQVVSNMLGSVWQALILATIVIFLFLGSVRRGIVVAISMPMSFLLTFAGMKLFNIQVDMVTLTAVILAIGMVVDASVVVLENITRCYQEGRLSPEEAARIGAVEIQFAVIAGNATTLTVLVPLLFLYGFVGKTFGPLAATLIIAFVSSLLVALSLVPILTALVTRDGGKVERVAARISSPWNKLMDRVRSGYVAVLKHSLRRRWLVFVTAAVLLVLALIILRFQGMELLPKMDGGASFVTVETPSGSSLDETENVIQEVEAAILGEPEVQLLYSQMGFEPGMHSFAGGGAQGPTQGYVSVTLTPRTERKKNIWEIQDRLREKLVKIPNIQNFVVRESGSTAKATTSSSIVISIRGEDPLILDRLGDQVFDAIREVDGVVNPYRTWRLDQRNVTISVDEERARELGISPIMMAQELVQSLDGVIVGSFRGELGQDTRIRVRYDRPYREEERDVFAVRTISAIDGKAIPMGTIAQGRETYVQGLVTREDLQPTLDVLALHQERPLNFVTADVARAVTQIVVPQGYAISLAGEEKDMGESRGELTGAMLIAFVAIYLLLVAQFRSFAHPITVLMAVPLSLIGVAISLWITGKSVSMPVLVGLILLIGIVVNNSIILIDFIRQRRSEGIERREAIVGSVSTRFRPIMMTSLSTIAGMIPLAMEWALGAERFSPLAIAVIGGMTASTLLTMVFIPVLYDAFDDLGTRLKPIEKTQ